ncbi:MAG: L,D-transpeptidase family protein [Hyphomicrobiaceae bacterium]
MGLAVTVTLASAAAIAAGRAGEPAASTVHTAARPSAIGVRIARRGSPPSRPDRPAVAKPAPQPPGPPEPLIAVVSLADQHIEVYGPHGSIVRSRVSTGQSGYATPTGVFSVLQRNRYHESNIYSGAPMPYMQRLTWSGIALHEGHVPGYPASHGCIRLPAAFAQTLWGMGRIGMRVVVSPRQVAPVGFHHPRLPQPMLLAAAPIPSGLVRLATASGAPAETSAAARQLPPYDAAQARLERAIAAKSAADSAVKPALELALARSAEAQQAAIALKAAQTALAEAEETLEVERGAMASVQTEEAEAPIKARVEAALAAAKAASQQHERLKTEERVASDAAFAAAAASREARESTETAAAELSLARKATAPISVFVSRKTGQVYVRQGYNELHEGPISISDQDRPLGTHVYTAVEGGGETGSIRWVAVSMPTSGGEIPRKARGEAVPESTISTASEALDRIELPEDVRRLVAERLWPGGSLIVSDYGLGETNANTDFVILTR